MSRPHSLLTLRSTLFLALSATVALGACGNNSGDSAGPDASGDIGDDIDADGVQPGDPDADTTPGIDAGPNDPDAAVPDPDASVPDASIPDASPPDADPPDADPPDAAPDPNVDHDGDGFVLADDCDDDNIDVHPDADEDISNDIDDDCDGDIDEVLVCALDGDYATIQAAIDDVPEGNVIEVCAGTYSEHLDIDKGLTLRSLDGAAATIIDATDTDRALAMINATGPITVEGFTFRNGTSGGFGGGVYCENSVLTLADSTIEDSFASSGGGFASELCQLDLSGNTVSGNQAEVTGGGLFVRNSNGEMRENTIEANLGFRAGGAAIVEGDMAILDNQILSNQVNEQGGGIMIDADSTFRGNTVSFNRSGFRGGGIVVDEHAPLLEDNIITENISGNDGGGTFLFLSEASFINNLVQDNVAGDDAGGLRLLGSQGTVIGNRFIGNHAASDGGAIKTSHNRSIFRDNLFENNIADDEGGGLELDDDHSEVKHNIFRGNTARRGGGIHGAEIGIPFTIENCLIVDNVATLTGGGIHLEQNGAKGTLSFLTIANNSAQSGTAIFFQDVDGDVENSMLIEEVPSGISLVRATGTSTQEFEFTNASPQFFLGITDPTGTAGNTADDAVFVDSANGNYQLDTGSAGIDTADPTLPDPDTTRADMGAFGGPGAMQP